MSLQWQRAALTETQQAYAQYKVSYINSTCTYIVPQSTYTDKSGAYITLK